MTTSCLKRFLWGFAGIPETKELDFIKAAELRDTIKVLESNR